jgi:hypothetical protein
MLREGGRPHAVFVDERAARYSSYKFLRQHANATRFSAGIQGCVYVCPLTPSSSRGTRSLHIYCLFLDMY